MWLLSKIVCVRSSVKEYLICNKVLNAQFVMIVARIFNVFDLKPTLLGKISWDLFFETVISSKSKFLGRKGFLYK